MKKRQRLIVTGIVQGVGFRPFVYGLAQQFDLSGFVGNDSNGVFIEVEGDPHQLTMFRTTLVNSPPPLAHIEAVSHIELDVQDTSGFTIEASEKRAGAHTFISPDLCICDDCLKELFTKQDRRYLYPFINCINCGPRLTIIRGIPYDRPLTSMAEFVMCAECDVEYHDPANRRFHAQPNACSVCGPRVWIHGEEEQEAIGFAQSALMQGKIVAVKGLGGFHLACDATDDGALQRLRERKGRVDKPFALMMQNMDVVRHYAEVNAEEERFLLSRERPIVLLQKKPNTGLSDLVAARNDYLGVMLPYTPLHYLLVQETPLVMTSGNISDEPIIKDNDEGLQRLATLADVFLMHNRDIVLPCDDSVMRVFQGGGMPIRRSRGYAPFPFKLPFEVQASLAVGGELKATFCVVTGNHAILSQHIGDMGNLETLQSFERTVAHYLQLFGVQPERIVCDMHPGYLSTQWAKQYARAHHIMLQQVQHHHAHIAAVMVENGLEIDRQVIGFCFDGTGYGTDGTIWGGEVLLTGYHGFERVAYLKPIPLPGGDAAIKRPYRVALTYLWAAGIKWDAHLPCVKAVSEQELRILRQQLERGFNTILSSSMGRLFDAIAALVGVRQVISYEAQAAIEFEAMATPNTDGVVYPFELIELDTHIEIDPTIMLRAIVDDMTNVPISIIAARFHATMTDIIVKLSIHFRAKFGIHTIALSGGVFQNVRLLQATYQQLQAEHFEVIYHRVVPSNDGGLALGQAVIKGG